MPSFTCITDFTFKNIIHIYSLIYLFKNAKCKQHRYSTSCSTSRAGSPIQFSWISPCTFFLLEPGIIPFTVVLSYLCGFSLMKLQPSKVLIAMIALSNPSRFCHFPAGYKYNHWRPVWGFMKGPDAIVPGKCLKSFILT